MAALRAPVATLSAALLITTGVGWWGQSNLASGFATSDALGADAPSSSGGSTNILLMGLDSRKDQQGNDLPQQVLDQLHAGDSSVGGYNTNTLILVHIPGDGGRPTAFSIPRDDYVAVSGIPGNDHVKIKEAYGLKKAAVEEDLRAQGVTDKATLETRGREAGRASTLATVRNLVGVPIDRFAEVNLAGFYDFTNALGGVDVCLNHAVHDSFSGANFPAGEQRLDAAQALAFVRQRHGLENGDLDRTHRQQAFLVSVAHELEKTGTFTNIGKLRALVEAAQENIVFSSGWDLVDFAQQVGKIAGDVEFQTLPVVRYDVIDGQDVNIVDPVEIKSIVRTAFGEEPAPQSTTAKPSSTVDVFNAGTEDGLASRVSSVLGSHGYTRGEVGNDENGPSLISSISYGSGAESDAEAVGTLLDLAATPDSDVSPGRIRVVLGSDFTMPESSAQSRGGQESGAAPSPLTSSSDADVPPPPDQGGVITGYGVPCVD
ncbi:transcriptional regulator, LytR family protein [Rhodococcus sp. WMMA185]|uniref:LCP family protein n=1 Tax=Rhodococcus sp. WMMA185 TaxID=679318 RepID=UPI0008791FA6|nr:LCP family protein [Rhodococcus sp. WMMA185]AOW92417.1 transcriptional regulator, LytR family protein [Rhodococcus sp. WMMA185]